ncbi:MAG: hypothetical protein LKI39_00035 [Bacteroides sp.]|jgi:hypothetical protein|nr:hypothetical protein [Bacteroides sp.]MCI1680927.1 hypothetical protein [Bacteroides sp.]
MNVKHFFSNTFCLLALSVLTSLSFSACSSDDDSWDDSGSTVTLPDSRVYILNEGTMGSNNSNIEFYAPNGDADIISNFFYTQNSAKLGDTGQDMITYNNDIYVSVNGSNYINRLNAAGVEQARHLFNSDSDSDMTGGIRYLAAKGGYIYASLYGGVIAKINAKTLEVEDKLTGIGNNLEGITICNNNLYVANSYKIENGSYIYMTDVFVIDLNTFTLTDTLTVTQNPNKLITADNKVFLISWDYSAESYVLQMIDPSNNNVTRLGYATNMAAGDGIVYLIDSRTDYSNWPETSTINAFSSYNISTGEMNSSSYLQNIPSELSSTSISMIQVNPNNGDIYIGTTFYSNSNGNIYRFTKNGAFVEKFDCGGQTPTQAVFLN